MCAQPKKQSTPKKKAGFRLEQLFGSKTRARLLGVLLNNPEDRFFVRELTRKIDAQLNSVRREIQNLVEIGIVQEVKAPVAKGVKKTAENKKFFQANENSILFTDLRALLQKAQVLLKKNLVQQLDELGQIDFLLLTGKFVQASTVPVDLLIVGELDQKTLRGVVSKFEQELGDEVNYTLMPREEFLYRKQITDRFLFSLLESDNITMIDRLSEET